MQSRHANSGGIMLNARAGVLVRTTINREFINEIISMVVTLYQACSQGGPGGTRSPGLVKFYSVPP